MPVPIPTVAPQDEWFTLTVGQINPSFIATVSAASYLSPSGATNGLIGTIDSGLIYLAGTNSPLDRGQKWLLWKADSFALADGENVFNPHVTPGIAGRWIATNIGLNPAGGVIVTSNALATLPAMQTSVVNVIVNKTIAGPTAIVLPGLGNVQQWQEFRVKDGKRDAGTNPITIAATGMLLDGAASFVIAVDNGYARFVCDGAEYRQI